MNLLHLIDRTELKLQHIKTCIDARQSTVESLEDQLKAGWMGRKRLELANLKEEREYLCEILTLLFKELETPKEIK